MIKNVITAIVGLLVCISASGQHYSDNVTLISLDGDNVTLKSVASANNKKNAEELALKSAYNALMHGGVEGLKNGAPMLTSETNSFDYRFFQENHHINYLIGKVNTDNIGKVSGVSRVESQMTINLKGLKNELLRNKLPVHPEWKDNASGNAPVGSMPGASMMAINPTIVIVPATNSQTGYSFESMRNIVENDELIAYALGQVSSAFKKNGYTTYDFLTQLQDAKNDLILHGGTQTDDATQMVQQLPGDIMVTVDADMEVSGDRIGELTLNVSAVERMTHKELGRKSFSSGQIHSTDSRMLTDVAVKTMNHEKDFFDQMRAEFEKMVQNGREVVISMQISETVDDWDLDCDSPKTGEVFKEAYEKFLREKAFSGAPEIRGESDKTIIYRVNIPMWNKEKNQSYTLSNFGSQLRRFFKSQFGDDYKAKVVLLGQKIEVTVE